MNVFVVWTIENQQKIRENIKKSPVCIHWGSIYSTSMSVWQLLCTFQLTLLSIFSSLYLSFYSPLQDHISPACPIHWREHLHRLAENQPLNLFYLDHNLKALCCVQGSNVNLLRFCCIWLNYIILLHHLDKRDAYSLWSFNCIFLLAFQNIFSHYLKTIHNNNEKYEICKENKQILWTCVSFAFEK